MPLTYCRNCGKNNESKVLSTKTMGKKLIRRRRCTECFKVTTTVEVSEDDVKAIDAVKTMIRELAND